MSKKEKDIDNGSGNVGSDLELSDIQDIVKNFGLGAYAGDDERLKTQFIPFGIPGLDTILGGGLPRNRFTMLGGDTAVGKSFLAIKLIANAQKTGCSVIYFNCLPKNTGILIPRIGRGGGDTIKIQNIVVGDKILSYNENTGEKEIDEVVDVRSRDSQEMFTVNFSNGNELRCTPEHKIGIIEKGVVKWKEACNVHLGDKVLQKKYKELNLRIKQIGCRGSNYDEMYGSEMASKKCAQHSAKIKEKYLDPFSGYNMGNFFENNRKRLKEFWNDDKYIKMHQKLGALRTPAKKEADIRRRQMFVDQWKDPNSIFNNVDFRNRRSKAVRMGNKHHEQPNSDEIRLMKMIEEVSPGEFEYNGDGRLLAVAGKIPDFVNVKGKKKLIELFGDFYHAPEEEEERKRIFSDNGYDTLIIWGRELRRSEETKKKIENFLFNPNAYITEIIHINRKLVSEKVYDIETKKNHNYFAQGILVHNCENKYSPEWFTTGGVDIKKLVVVQGNIMESVWDSMIAFAEKGVDLVVLDSLAALVPSVMEDAAMADQASYTGKHAYMVAKGFQKIMPALSMSDRKTKTAFLFLNQIRENIRMSPFAGGGDVIYPGGKSIEHYCSIKARVRRGEWDQETKKDVTTRRGFQIVVRTEKNQVHRPFMEATVPFLFTGEIDAVASLALLAQDLGMLTNEGASYFFKGEKIAYGWLKCLELFRNDKVFYDKLYNDVVGRTA